MIEMITQLVKLVTALVILVTVLQKPSKKD